MRYQELEVSCGAASLVNAFRALGRKISEARIRKAAGTDYWGTAEEGIVTAATNFGFNAEIISINSKQSAWRIFKSALVEGSPIIVPVDFGAHWVTCIGLIGDSVIVADPYQWASNIKENGIQVFTKDRLMTRIRSHRKAENTSYYGIIISKQLTVDPLTML